ncbi:hypothetical protein CBR_g3493 [Chara braunii]|uniref:Uncharacterized protein n=1 Tax=Chara braunii TaxID=69332 RepID=A0A388JQZ3_CHABU|nr:hypothetical protein CBR_g3493 [Chara braunii]|eukprot:GBG60249.1 hypothetical protein CBR_g3493 [Chara braunii]
MKIVADQHAMAKICAPESSVRLQQEFDETKRQAQEANERRIAALEQQVLTLKRVTEEALEEVNRIREFNRRREAEQEAERVREEKDREIEKLKEALSRVQMESIGKQKVASTKQRRHAATDLRQRLEAATKGVDGCVDRGKKAAVLTNDREVFLKDCRRELKPLKRDAVVAICENEGITYTTLEKAKEEIVQLRTRRACDEAPPGNREGVVFEDLTGASEGQSADLGKFDGGEDNTS